MKKIKQPHKATQPYQLAVDEIRTTLTDIIRCAVEKYGCIGTYYKNRGVHHSEIDFDNSEEYLDTFAVVVKSGHPADYGGFVAASVFDIYINPETSKLEITLNGESGDDFDELLELVQLEGLTRIVEWLFKNEFIAPDEDIPDYHCKERGCTDVERKAWVKPNEDNKFVEYCNDDDEEDDNWCHDCDHHIELIDRETFMKNINEWWGQSDFKTMEKVTKFRQLDFDPQDGYQEFVDACDSFWENLSSEQKIITWKTLT